MATIVSAWNISTQQGIFTNGRQGNINPIYDVYGAGGQVSTNWSAAGGPSYIKIIYLGE